MRKRVHTHPPGRAANSDGKPGRTGELRRRGLLFYWDANTLAFREGGRQGAEEEHGRSLGVVKRRLPRASLISTALPCGWDSSCALEI